MTEKERKTVLIRQGCGVILASLALSLNLSDTAGIFKESAGRWGTDMVITVSGLAVLFLIAGKSERKSLYLDAVCCLFAFCTVLGRSFMESGSYHALIGGYKQICKAILAGGGIT